MLSMSYSIAKIIIKSSNYTVKCLNLQLFVCLEREIGELSYLILHLTLFKIDKLDKLQIVWNESRFSLEVGID